MRWAWRRETLAFIAAFAALRLAAIIGTTPQWYPDSIRYEQLNFAGDAQRPWTVPLVYTLLPADELRMLFQTIVSITAFAAFAVTLAQLFHRPACRWAALLTVFAIGLTPRATVWDTTMLSESLAISLTLLLMTAMLRLDQSRTSAAMFLVVFVLWVFARDAHNYLAVLVAAVVIVPLWRWHRYAIGVVAVVLVWSFLAASNNRDVEAYNVAGNIGARHTDVDWFVDHGMPRTATFDLPAGEARQMAATSDPELLDWAGSNGPSVYARYLLTHPAFTFGSLETIFVDDDYNHASMIDTVGYITGGRPVIPATVAQTIWPDDGATLIIPLLVAAVTAVIARRRELEAHQARLVAPLLILVSTIPHALLAYHGAPSELARHGLLLALLLNVSAIWLLLVALDVPAD